MKDLLREHIAEIALLIYILYPLLKRVFDRRKKQREQASQRAEAKKSTSSATQPHTPAPAAEPARPEPPPPSAVPPPAATRPAEPDFLGAARSQAQRLTAESSRLLGQAQANPRLSRFVPALRDDLLGRLRAIERSLDRNPTLSTLVQETTALGSLEELVRHLSRMMRQRILAEKSLPAYGDPMVDDCYAPLIEFSRAQNLELRTAQPIAVTGDWDSSVIPRLASTRVAPIRLPVDFERSVWQWPAIAREVARDFYYSFEHLEQDLHARLGLPYEAEVPASDRDVDARWLAQLLGVWLPELFADVMGALMLGPAYVQMLGRTYRNPGSPQRTAAIFRNGTRIDDRPPARLRVHAAVRVLHHLGRHREADELWALWETENPDVSLYFLPLGGRWAGLADEALHSVADSVLDTLALHPWPELEGFQLMNIPDLAYLHAEHAEVERLTSELGRGSLVAADSRWIIAAAVLAASAQPALHDSILETARRSIAGVGPEERTPERRTTRTAPSRTIAQILLSSVKSPKAVREAIVLGAALEPHRRRLP